LKSRKFAPFTRHQQRGVLQTVLDANRIHMAQDQISNFGLTLIGRYFQNNEILEMLPSMQHKGAVILGKNPKALKLPLVEGNIT
jgi:hypothetical protein